VPMPTLLEVDDLGKAFASASGSGLRPNRARVQAVDGVSFSLADGEVLGVVGESGSGKSTLGRLIARLIKPDRGRILLKGREITGLGGRELRTIRRHIQLVFQDSYGSLNPRMTAKATIGYPLRIGGVNGGETAERVALLAGAVGLTAEQLDRYPHQLSGGQRQRVGIARALALRPSLIIADEPVSALDVSTQAQILNLLRKVRIEFGVAFLFITHDLAVARYLSDRLLVMYAGRVVEVGPVSTVFDDPAHPYTRALLQAATLSESSGEASGIPVLEGDPPDPASLPLGCKFAPRCPFAQPLCAEVEPHLLGGPRAAACHMTDPRYVDLWRVDTAHANTD
jgi:oligopeptide transport system ATP-binding protein